MARIFLSYRRADGVASGARSAIYQKLTDHYGRKSVFMDVERMQVARDFRESIQEEISKSDVVLVLIGPDWAKHMRERSGDDSDFVRIEIETALEQEKPVLPILLGEGTKMPGAGSVPKSIKAFTFNHGVQLDTGRYFNEGMKRLCDDMDEHIFKGQIPRRLNRKQIQILAAGAAVVVVLGIWLTMGSISEDTGSMAESLETIATNFEDLKTDGIIDDPEESYEFYHNARFYELSGDYANARKAYLGYFRFNEEKLDPHLRYTDFLKIQEGIAGARESYHALVNQLGQENMIPRFVAMLLWDRDRRVELLPEFAKEQPDFAPVYYLLSLDYSAARQGSQTVDDLRHEKQNLELFLEKDQAGNLVKYMIDQELVGAWRSDAAARLVRLESGIADSVLENPVNVSWMQHNTGWSGYVQIAETFTEILWKTSEMTDFKAQPKTGGVDPQTGQPMPFQSISLPTSQGATTIEIKYFDRTGVERGPYAFQFQPGASAWASDIHLLSITPTSWLQFVERDNRLQLFFTHLLSYRGAIAKITYGLDREVPDTEFGFPPWDKPGTSTITGNITMFVEVPQNTRFATVQLDFKDGTRSEIVRLDR